MHWASVEAARSCDGTVVPGSRVPASVLTEANGPRGWQVPRKPNYGGQMRSRARTGRIAVGNDSGAGAVERRAPGQMEAPAGRPGFDGVVGSPIEYAAAEFLGEDGWSLTPQSARDWAATTAGAPIKDPVTGANQPYWYCNISPDERSGPAGLKAEFDLFMFGRRGLAVCRGTTESFVASPGGTRWRQTRFDLPVDPARIRNDHRRGALSNTGVNSTAPSAKSASPAGVSSPIISCQSSATCRRTRSAFSSSHLS